MSWTSGGGVVFSQFLECINLIWERRKESVQKSRPACQCVENRPQWQTHKNDFGYFSKKRSHKKRSFNSQADRKGCPPPGHFLWFFGVRLISDYEYISLSEKKGGGKPLPKFLATFLQLYFLAILLQMKTFWTAFLVEYLCLPPLIQHFCKSPLSLSLPHPLIHRGTMGYI